MNKLIENHTFSTSKGNYFFGVNKFDLFKMDDDIYECVKRIKNGGKIEEENPELIDELIEAGILVENEKLNNYGKVWEFVDFPVQSLALHLVHDCNLRCTYCYGDGGSYGGVRKPMSEEVAMQAVDFLIKNSQDLEQVNITLFGGEPLLNMPLIHKIVEYCKVKEKETGKKITLSTTTNATLLNEETRTYLNENNISVGISIDGPREIHDSCRVNVEGNGSFDYMIHNTEKLLEERDGRVTARITVTRNCLEIDRIMRYIEKMGFRKVNVAFVSGEDDSPITIKQEDFIKIGKEYEKIAERMYEALKNDIPFYNNIFYSHLRQLNKKFPMLYSCGAGRKYFAVDPDGNLYICHRFVGKDEYKVGNVFGTINREKVGEVAYAYVEHKDECKSCWARYLCAGGCFYNSYENGGNLLAAPKEYCELYKKMYEVAIELYYRLNEISPDFMDELFIDD